MKKMNLLLAVMAMSSIAYADGPRNGTKDLLNAISLCPSPNNPLEDGLKKLGGNVFGKAYANDDRVTGSVLINVRAIESLNSLNKAIMASDREVGAISLTVRYENKGFDRPLKCELSVQPLQ